MLFASHLKRIRCERVCEGDAFIMKWVCLEGIIHVKGVVRFWNRRESSCLFAFTFVTNEYTVRTCMHCQRAIFLTIFNDKKRPKHFHANEGTLMLAFENFGLWCANIDFETNTTMWMIASRLTSLSKQVNKQFSQLSEQKQTPEATRLGSVVFDVIRFSAIW